MEKLISLFLGNIKIIMFVITILFVGMVILINSRNNKKSKKIVTLNKKTIVTDSRLFVRLIMLVLLVVFLIAGLLLILLSLKTSTVLFNMVTGTVIGSIFCLVSLILIIIILSEYIKLMTGQYAIVIDELSDKYYYIEWGVNSDSIDHSGWQLYFKDYYAKYNKSITRRGADEYKIGDKYYLVFIRGNKLPYIFNLSNYTLAESENSKLCTLNEAKEYIRLKEFAPDTKEANKETITISKDRIKKEFLSAGHVKTIIAIVLITICLLVALIMQIINSKELAVIIVISIITLFFIFFAFIKIDYVLKITNSINKGNIIVKEDEVVSLNNLIDYRDSNTTISFKFKDYKKIVFENKKEYYNTEVGDKFYLVFVKGEKEPIKVYSQKNSVLDSDLNIK